MTLSNLIGRDLKNALNDMENVTQNAQDAKVKAELAEQLASQAKQTSDQVKDEFDRVVADAGENNAEVVQARGLEVNLNARLNKKEKQLAQTEAELDETKTKLKPRKLRPIATFTLDDGTSPEYTQLFPLFQQKGVRPTTGIIANRIGTSGFMTIEQIRELKAAGWEIASHSYTHEAALTTFDDARLVHELKDSKDFLNDLGLNVKNFLLPFGNVNDNIMNLASRYYRSMRVSGVGATGELNKPPIATFRVNSILVGDTTGVGNGIDPTSGQMFDTLDYWKWWVDESIRTNSWIVFISHADVIVSRGRVAELGELMDYVKSKAIDIMTLDEGLGVFENYVDAERFKIGADGRFSGEYGKLRLAPNDTVLNGTSLTDIEPLMVTANVVTSGNRTGFPTNRTGGTVVTVKPDNNSNRAFQLYKPYGAEGGLYFRDYGDNNAPSNWTDLKDIYVWQAGALAPTHSGATLVEGKVNFYTVNAASATGWPENAQGFLTAYRMDGDFSSIYETFKLRNSPKIYTRYWNTATAAWSDWSQQLDVIQLNSGSYTPTTAVDSFPVGTSFKQITQGEATGWPDNTAGLLETRNIMWNGYKYQYYHILNSTKTFKRVWKTDATWSAWTQVNA